MKQNDNYLRDMAGAASLMLIAWFSWPFIRPNLNVIQQQAFDTEFRPPDQLFPPPIHDQVLANGAWEEPPVRRERPAAADAPTDRRAWPYNTDGQFNRFRHPPVVVDVDLEGNFGTPKE